MILVISFCIISVPQLHFDIVILNQIIEEQQKRILSLTNEHKQLLKRQTKEHNHMMDFIKNISPTLTQSLNSSTFNSNLTHNCNNKCYRSQADDTKDSSLFSNVKKDEFDLVLARRNQLCKEICSTFTDILESNESKKNYCSTSIPMNTTSQLNDQNKDVPKNLVVPIIIRGRRIHSDSVTKERWKEFKDMMKANNVSIEKLNATASKNATLLSSVNTILSTAFKPFQEKFSQKRSVSSSLCPSFSYEHIFLKGVKNASIVRQVEDRNTTLINRTGG